MYANTACGPDLAYPSLVPKAWSGSSFMKTSSGGNIQLAFEWSAPLMLLLVAISHSHAESSTGDRDLDVKPALVAVASILMVRSRQYPTSFRAIPDSGSQRTEYPNCFLSRSNLWWGPVRKRKPFCGRASATGLF